MGRSADYTIQGFLYQFNITLSEILKAADEADITIEGIIEDIKVATITGNKAIQCKYHETQTKYTLSTLYHPLLQMMKHFKLNPGANIKYHLFAHFPNISSIPISSTDLNKALDSKNKDLKILISEATGVDIDKFIEVFSVKVVPKYDDLMKENIKLLVDLGFNEIEVETLFYPNAIHIIGELSIKHDENLRKITKSLFLDKLRLIRSTAVSQWTLALNIRHKILEARRKQLKENLNTNVRLRFILIFPTFLEQFDNQIVLFIKSFVDKYHYKQVHTQTPIFILDVSRSMFDEIAERLVGKNVALNLGRPVNNFVVMNFFVNRWLQKIKKSSFYV